ncbi:hypothetical protein [Pimelobacter simplex]|uniref:hypothetical protein n=1 Tax=Nocardioides simplex TaxID=2045 RepID=UPI00214F73FA|nr:hypothetical protein [Pimelobacter simplex]UUW88355.1 hypothetical protein M0M43_21785 [Pimelobacter simplex]UUW97859.1 hypothetical protein M0M48_10430 [Pimelobacter simplex]
MADPVITGCIQNTRAAALVLAHAETVGLPDPMSVAVARQYDNEVSRNAPRIRFQFKTADDLQTWADYLGAEVRSLPSYASAFGGKAIASVWHHDAVTEWLDVPLALTAVTEHPIRSLAVVP